MRLKNLESSWERPKRADNIFCVGFIGHRPLRSRSKKRQQHHHCSPRSENVLKQPWIRFFSIWKREEQKDASLSEQFGQKCAIEMFGTTDWYNRLRWDLKLNYLCSIQAYYSSYHPLSQPFHLLSCAKEISLSLCCCDSYYLGHLWTSTPHLDYCRGNFAIFDPWMRFALEIVIVIPDPMRKWRPF